MAKIIKYKFVSAEVNHGTEEEPKIEQITLGASLKCKTQADYDANYSIAEKEAIPGTIEVTGEFDPEEPIIPTPTQDYATYEELAEAFSQGVDSI